MFAPPANLPGYREFHCVCTPCAIVMFCHGVVLEILDLVRPFLKVVWHLLKKEHFVELVVFMSSTCYWFLTPSPQPLVPQYSDIHSLESPWILLSIPLGHLLKHFDFLTFERKSFVRSACDLIYTVCTSTTDHDSYLWYFAYSVINQPSSYKIFSHTHINPMSQI